ncbi:hypothetical protein Ctha_1906 [Chloroherpeton thalassium ATCC 35110]|uniref:Uncharacterized protein n=1 Tax=Chloroherpeton thalassium (strain ATCC 35110 / GB-78) TaxID=517418 RepID=B3QUB1_CHLT3|nr:hypothetical protein Ctha_1906 [Chloroherpeton thalassium ATCC 35110]
MLNMTFDFFMVNEMKHLSGVWMLLLPAQHDKLLFCHAEKMAHPFCEDDSSRARLSIAEFFMSF